MARKRKHQPGCPCCKSQGKTEECGLFCQGCTGPIRLGEGLFVEDDNGSWPLYPLLLGNGYTTNYAPHKDGVAGLKNCKTATGRVHYDYQIGCGSGLLGLSMYVPTACCRDAIPVPFPPTGYRVINEGEPIDRGALPVNPLTINRTCSTDRIVAAADFGDAPIGFRCQSVNGDYFGEVPILSRTATATIKYAVAKPQICCSPCGLPKRDLRLNWFNPLLGHGSVVFPWTGKPFAGWSVKCFSAGFDAELSCATGTGGATALRVAAYTSGTCPTGQTQSCSSAAIANRLVLGGQIVCDPLSMKWIVTAADCPILWANGFEWFEVTAP